MKDIVEIDDIDREIIGILQEDATRAIQDIANQVGLTNNPCWRRIKRLEETGVIKSRVAIIDAKKLGLGSTAFVTIRIDSHNREWLDGFARCVQEFPEIVECHRMTGDVDYLLKIAIRDLEHYDRVYQRLITAVPGLTDVSSTFSMESLKQRSGIDVSSVPE